MDYAGRISVRLRTLCEQAHGEKPSSIAENLVEFLNEDVGLFAAWAKHHVLSSQQAARLYLGLVQDSWTRSGKLDRLLDIDPDMYDLLIKICDLHGPRLFSQEERELLSKYIGAPAEAASNA